MKLGQTTIHIDNDQNIGSRHQQEDYFAVIPEEEKPGHLKTLLLVLADGMGGLAEGDAASVVAVEHFVKNISCRDVSASHDVSLHNASHYANQAVLQTAKGRSAGTTLVAMLLDQQTYTWVSVGDSVIFRLRNGQLQRLNQDHNLGSQIDQDLLSGDISNTQAANKADERHLLTSHLGLPELPKLDISREQPWQPGDTFVLCSDGLTNTLSFHEIQHILRQQPPHPCRTLVHQALLKKMPGQDNISAVSATLVPSQNNKLHPFFLSGLAVGLLLLAVGLFWLFSAPPSRLVHEQITDAGMAKTGLPSPSIPDISQPTPQIPVPSIPDTPPPTNRRRQQSPRQNRAQEQKKAKRRNPKKDRQKRAKRRNPKKDRQKRAKRRNPKKDRQKRAKRRNQTKKRKNRIKQQNRGKPAQQDDIDYGDDDDSDDD